MRKAGFQEVQTKRVPETFQSESCLEIFKRKITKRWEIQDTELQRGTRGHEVRLRKESSEEVPA